MTEATGGGAFLDHEGLVRWILAEGEHELAVLGTVHTAPHGTIRT